MGADYVTMKIPLMRPYFDSDELKEIKKVLNSGWVSQGPETKKFEKCAREYLGIKHTIPVTNCTAALHLALLSIGIKKGDEVLVADYTYPATGHSVVYCGAKPRFVDVDVRTYNINPELLKHKLTTRTKAIIPVHTFGQPADMDPIMEFAADNNLKVIEDAACAFGAKYKKKYAGTIGDIGCYSFHARKGLTTGEGGMIATRDDTLAEKMRCLSIFGIKAAWDREGSKKFSIPTFIDIGYNYKMSDITAAIGVVQLKRLDKVITKKKALAKLWDEHLIDMSNITPPYIAKNVEHIYQTYNTRLSKNIDRNNIITRLADVGVQTNIGTYASHIQPVYKSKDKCPKSLEIFHTSLALPLFYRMTHAQVEIAARKLKKELEV